MRTSTDHTVTEIRYCMLIWTAPVDCLVELGEKESFDCLNFFTGGGLSQLSDITALQS